MTAKPRRYVRVRRVRQWSHHSRFGRYYAPWSEAICAFCPYGIDKEDHPAAILAADEHARTCPAVAAAMERDRLAAELATERADNSRLRADRAVWRTTAIRLQADLIEAREERA